MPRNKVQWLKDGGIEFDRRGIVISSRSFTAASSDGPCSLEIVLRPKNKNIEGTILAFDDSDDPDYIFALRQFGDALAIQRRDVDSHLITRRLWWQIAGVFQGGSKTVLTITSMSGKTALYVNGILLHTSSRFALIDNDLTGKLILGNSARADGWSGQVLGLGIYHSALSAAQVHEHSLLWASGKMSAAMNQDAVALYLFDKSSDGVIDDTIGVNSLEISSHYRVACPAFLKPIWKQYRSRWDGWRTWSYWSDVLLNIMGFVPLGFILTAHLSRQGTSIRSRILALLLGVTLSVVIEVTQYFLPTRNSSMTDLLMNTIGTAVGVMLFRGSVHIDYSSRQC